MKTETTPKAETESRTRIQAYSKSQLAGLYLPHIQSASARRTLRSWIAKNTALQAALAQTGYSEKSHPAHSGTSKAVLQVFRRALKRLFYKGNIIRRKTKPNKARKKASQSKADISSQITRIKL